MPSKKLFSDFAAISKQTWKDKATQDLKGADFDEKLLWHVEQDLKQAAFYHREDSEQIRYLEDYANNELNTNINFPAARHWYNQVLIQTQDPKKANQLALHALNNGADALLFQVDAYVDLEILLADVLLEHCRVSFILNEKTLDFVAHYIHYAFEKGVTLEKLSGSLFCATDDIPTLKSLIIIDRNIPHFYPITIQNPQPYEQPSEDLAQLLAKAVSLSNTLLDEGLQADNILKHIEFSCALSNSYFLNIAKIRTLKLLFGQISAAYQVQSQPFVHAFTSLEAREDQDWNMLSNTTQAMSAILGGANALTVLPHNQLGKQDDDFGMRIARNVSNILREESYFDKVADPVAGSYYVENLSHQLAKKTWERFQELV